TAPTQAMTAVIKTVIPAALTAALASTLKSMAEPSTANKANDTTKITMIKTPERGLFEFPKSPDIYEEMEAAKKLRTMESKVTNTPKAIMAFSPKSIPLTARTW